MCKGNYLSQITTAFLDKIRIYESQINDLYNKFIQIFRKKIQNICYIDINFNRILYLCPILCPVTIAKVIIHLTIIVNRLPIQIIDINHNFMRFE